MLEPIVHIKIGEESFALKPTFRVISQIENALGRSLPKIIAEGIYGEKARGLLQDELFNIIRIAIEGIGRKVASEAIEEFIMRNRIEATILVANFLGISFRTSEYAEAEQDSAEDGDKKK